MKRPKRLPWASHPTKSIGSFMRHALNANAIRVRWIITIFRNRAAHRWTRLSAMAYPTHVRWRFVSFDYHLFLYLNFWKSVRCPQDGDLCNVDVTVYHRGFHGDLNETFFVGNVSEKHKNLVKVTYEALQKAIGIVKPGERYREIGNVIQKHVQTHGYSVVKSYCGHGIHRLFHTAPNVPHYASK